MLRIIVIANDEMTDEEIREELEHFNGKKARFHSNFNGEYANLGTDSYNINHSQDNPRAGFWLKCGGSYNVYSYHSKIIAEVHVDKSKPFLSEDATINRGGILVGMRFH